ncbi:TraM recognition domain-containing protein [Conexibacter sp. W3-3-2]|nr:TraM recognition domain-containing protein [Conexibacter sp. W3-3-2]
MADRTAEDDPWVAIEMAAVLGTAAVTLVAIPFATQVVNARAVAGLNVVSALVSSLRIAAEGHWADPAQAFPAEARGAMPGPIVWWFIASTVMVAACTAATLTWRRVDAYVSRASLARRPYDARGSRQRTWARRRDLRDAIVRSRQPGRFTLGRLDGRLIASHPESHVALIAPTRSGKTTRYVIPWLLEHDGPAVVTSTKLDVVEATAEARARDDGRVWIWDPFGAESATWSPLRGCDDWSYALAQAQWIADAADGGDSEIAAYWRGEAAKLLAPLLHAAALDKQTMSTVLAWVDAQEIRKPVGILSDAARVDAKRQIEAVSKLDDRNKGTTYMSAGSLLAAYRYPELERAGDEFTLDEFLSKAKSTLYVVASARHQRLLGPLVVGLLSSILHEAADRTRQQKPLERSLRLLLDETANIAPLRDLPSHLSQAAGNGVRIATIWQSLAQIHERYPRGADGVLANSTTKLFLGPVTDEKTRRFVQGLIGEEPKVTTSKTVAGAFGDAARASRTRSQHARSAASAPQLQQLARDRALLVEGAQKPATLTTAAWWEDWPTIGS